MAPAQLDMTAIEAYTLKTWGRGQADKYLAGIEDRLDDLARSPAMGAAFRHGKKSMRVFPVGRHVIYYRVTASELIVLRVLHKRMDAGRHLR